jgi:hypothetical protein
MNDFDNLLTHIETWRGAYAAQHPAPVPRGTSRSPETLLVKSIRPCEPVGEAVELYRQVRGGPSRRAVEQFAKSIEQADDSSKAILDAKAAAKRESEAREAKAGWLRGILNRIDEAIAAGKLTAHEVAVLENKVHAAAQKIGAV